MSAGAITILALLVYTYAGYPVVIGLLARAARRRIEPLPAPDVAPFVSICLPVFNGARTFDPPSTASWPRITRPIASRS